MCNIFTVIIPFHNGHKTIDELINSINKYVNVEIVVVDDHSNIPLTKLPYGNVKILKSNRRGYFAGAVNVGINNTSGDVLILNQDTKFSGNGWLEQVLEAKKNGYHYIGERISGKRDDWPNGYIHGTFMYLTREVIQRTGLLNEKLFPMWGCTAEYQLRVARNNMKVLPLEHVEDFVHEREGGFGESFQQLFREQPENRKLYTSTPPLVSVIIPTHNYSQFLQSTVNCLVGGKTDLGIFPQQTFASFEVIIVDDSSTDDTPDIISKLTDSWKGVRSIRLDRPRDEVWDDERNKYTGKVVAVNAGIKASYGKYILTLDADDMMWSNRMERFFNIQNKNPHSFVYDNFQFFNGERIVPFTYPEEAIEILTSGGIIRKPHPKAGQQTEFPELQDYDFDTLIFKNHVHSSIMFPREAGLYPERFKYGREDWAMAVKLGINGYCGIRDRNHGFLYRRQGHNRTLENTNPTWMKYFQSQMYQEYKNIYEGDRPMGCCGKGAKNKSKTQAFAGGSGGGGIERAVPDMEGMVKVEYVGNRSSGEHFNVYGHETGTQYRVKPRERFNVDERDLKDPTNKKRGILNYLEGNKYVFRVVEEQPIVQEVVEPEEEQVVNVVQEITESVDEEEPEEKKFNPMDGNFKMVKGYLKKNSDSITREDLVEWTAYEVENRNRSSLIAIMEEMLNGLD